MALVPATDASHSELAIAASVTLAAPVDCHHVASCNGCSEALLS